MSQFVEPRTILWTQTMYYAAAEGGAFGDRRTELIEGAIIEMSPMSSKHGVVIHLVQDALQRIIPAGHFVATQIPLDLGEISEPQPDIAVYRGLARDYIDAKPTEALLVVEVADSSLSFDRGEKASLYAKAGVADYWIVNLRKGTLEVNRVPVEQAPQPFGYGYKVTSSLTVQDQVSPLARPTLTLAVADLLP